MQITYPKSFLKLLLIGFALVILPLIAAFVNANLQFNKLTQQSLFNMSQAVETTRASQIMLEELAVMERSARQYFVLRDQVLLSNFNQAHERLGAALNILLLQPIALPQHTDLMSFTRQENDLFQSITQAQHNKADFDDSMVLNFATLTNLANQISTSNNALIDQEAVTFKVRVSKVKKALFWQMLTIFPLVLIIAALITWMIARPIRRMDAAINQLGQGDYEHVIHINGPGDLRQLGSRLDWLRIALKDLHQQKQRFLQQASHELKTPLTAIREASELLHDGVAGNLNTQQNQIVTILRDSSLRLQRMIENLLKYTEIQFNAAKSNVSQQALNVVIQKVLQAYALTIAHKNIDVQQSITDMQVQLDIEKLSTVLDNLISNAVKYTPEHGKISIHATRTKNDLEIAIKDNGPGIPDANQKDLFSPFYHGEQASDSLVASSGLGLFIAKEAASALQGELRYITSDAGAHFLVRIPLSSMQPNHEQPTEVTNR